MEVVRKKSKSKKKLVQPVIQISLPVTHPEEEAIEKDEVNETSEDVEEGAPKEIKFSSVEEVPFPEATSSRSLVENEQLEENTVKKETFESLLQTNKQLLTELKIEDIKTISEETLTKEKPKFKIKPYTESELKALYSNSELTQIKEFTSQFIEAELKESSVQRHLLYDLLTNYLKAREKLTLNSNKIIAERKKFEEFSQKIWTVQKKTVTGHGVCSDGFSVSANHTFSESTFHRREFEDVKGMLVKLLNLTQENHALFAYSAEDLRLQIEHFIQNSITNLLTVTQLSPKAPVVLLMEPEPLHIKPFLNEIRICISVLFAFQRKFIRDLYFLKETREWLRKLVAVLLRLASYQDHLFILYHVLRCPAGVSSWATSFVQIPLLMSGNESPFASYQINHLLAILSVILSPVIERDKFLQEINHHEEIELGADAIWVMVDSEGEDDEEGSSTLKENDLVLLVNQLPIDDLFRLLLNIKTKDFKDFHEDKQTSEYHLLKYLSLSTSLLQIIHGGLDTYSQPKYKQFSKRLSRFIRHITQYATEQWEEFLKNRRSSDEAMMQRLQVEYDSFFQRAIFYLYSSQKLGAWQFLAVVPYHLVSIEVIWKIFYFLHCCDEDAKNILNPLENEGFKNKLWDKELRRQFEEKLASIEFAEIDYLLTTFANMALARNEEDQDFIFEATMDLLEVGFLNLNTQDNCWKSSRILLSHITSKYPHLLSCILKKVSKSMEKIDSLSLELFEFLPLTIWQVADEDLERISKLLLNSPVNSISSKLARMIISRLNYDLLPYKKHCDIAILVATATDKELSYENWGWQTILRLKLHKNDKFYNDSDQVQDLDKHGILLKGLREQKPLASFIILLMTSYGHSIPLICTKGLEQMLFLQTHQRHEAVLFALFLIVPLFVANQECLINCEPFQQVLTNLINADRGYISMAKNLFLTQKNVFLEQFGNMIQTQIVCYSSYDLENPKCLLRLWINSLASIPQWTKDPGILYLLDVIVKTSFSNSECLDVAYNVLKELYQCTSPSQESSSSTISSLFKWVTNNNSDASLINYVSKFSWLAFLIIKIEHEERELRNGLWREILLQLSKQTSKVNVDLAIKNACKFCKVSSFPSSSLCIFRWAQQALDTPLEHPVLPLLWQNFFKLFLTRVIVPSPSDVGCVGDKFFEGLVNFAFFKKIKRRLQESVEHFEKLCEDSEQPYYNIQFRQMSLKLFRAFSLWLEEPRLHKNNFYVQNLPPEYEPVLLGFIWQGSEATWFEYLNRTLLDEEQAECTRTWRISKYREKTNVNKPLPTSSSLTESSNPIERILQRLKSYDKPKEAPSISIESPLIGRLAFGNKKELFQILDEKFYHLKQFAHTHCMNVSHHKTTNSSYIRFMPQLFKSVAVRKTYFTPCKDKNDVVKCSGAATIHIDFNEAQLNDLINEELREIGLNFEPIFDVIFKSPAKSFCLASVTLQQVVKILKEQALKSPHFNELGVELFYHILTLLNTEVLSCFPTKSLLTNCLELLGQAHISNHGQEMPRLLERILKEPALSFYLSQHFSPSHAETSDFLAMYSNIFKEMRKQYDVTFSLLSKFEVEDWLLIQQPKINERVNFIDLIIKGLTSLGFEVPDQAQLLHALYCRHLITLLKFQFPEHFDDILVQLLNASNGSQDHPMVSLGVWKDFLKALTEPIIISKEDVLSEKLRLYAQSNRRLPHQMLLDLADMLARYFSGQRLQFGLYGLYPKCRNYMEMFEVLIGITGFGLVSSVLQVFGEASPEKIVEVVWSRIRDLFAPWLMPYSMEHFKDNMASWIQQLADDRTVLLPWIEADDEFARRMCGLFVDTLLFLHTLQPGCTSILSCTWQWYCHSYCHPFIKSHVILPINDSLIKLPWNQYWPSETDLELMLRIIDQPLPDAHSLLNHIFMSVPWINWLKHCEQAPKLLKSRIYQCYINVLVKLTILPIKGAKNLELARDLLKYSELLDWSVLEVNVYQHVMDWFVMSCDPVVIFKQDQNDKNYQLLEFLKVVAGYHVPAHNPSSDVLHKRMCFVRSVIKLLSVYTSRHKHSLSSKEKEIQSVVYSLLYDFENNVLSYDEMFVFMPELLTILNIALIRFVSIKAFKEWICKKSGDGFVVRVLLKTAGVAVSDQEMLAELLETCIVSYFYNIVTESFEPTWKELCELIVIFDAKKKELESNLVLKGYIMSLFAIIMQCSSKNANLESLCYLVLSWMSSIKITEHIEEKVPLLWFALLKFCQKVCETDQSLARSILQKFAQILMQLSDVKIMKAISWGRNALSAMGFKGQETTSINFKFLCRALAGYILAQLPEMKGKPQIVRNAPQAPCKVGQSGGNTECAKLLMSLDFRQSQGNVKESAELALRQIQDADNSLHNVGTFLQELLKRFYLAPYYKDL